MLLAERVLVDKMLPSKATLNRTRLRADLADMLRWRELWKELVPDCTILVGFDSSVYRSRAYEVFVATIVKKVTCYHYMLQ